MIATFSSCTKDAGTPGHVYKVGDTTFSGSYVQLGFSGNDFYEKEAAIPTKGSIVSIFFDKGISGTVPSSDSFYIYVVDSFGTYGLGGNVASQYLATSLVFKCAANQTGNCPIGSGIINQNSPFMSFVADNTGAGFVNVFHNDKDYIQGTINCPFYNNGGTYAVAGSFKIYKHY